MSAPIIIRKSFASYLSSLMAALICLVAVVYSFAYISGLIFKIVAIIALLPFLIFTISKVLSRKVQLSLSDEGITFLEKDFIKWSEIKEVYLDTRRLNIATKGGRTKLTYLNIEPIFSGQFSNQRVVKSFVVSDMEMPPSIILHHIRAFLHRYNLSILNFTPPKNLP